MRERKLCETCLEPHFMVPGEASKCLASHSDAKKSVAYSSTSDAHARDIPCASFVAFMAAYTLFNFFLQPTEGMCSLCIFCMIVLWVDSNAKFWNGRICNSTL